MRNEQKVDEIRSMTGFGSGAAEGAGFSVRVELRAVNHRGLKLNVRSRPNLGVWEKELRDLLAARLERGAVDAFVTLTRHGGSAGAACVETARELIGSLRALAQELQLPGELRAADLLQVPGLFDEAGWSVFGEAEWAAGRQATEAALAQLLDMRRAEGAVTAARLGELIAPVATFAAEVRRLAPGVIERSRVRIRERLNELLGGLRPADEQAVEREICLLADRVDVNEELDRLGSHLGQYQALLASGREVGKRLEFLAQEILREVNTCSTKAADAAVSALAVEAKLAVEKIKEQAANLE